MADGGSIDGTIAVAKASGAQVIEITVLAAISHLCMCKLGIMTDE